jgi:hypothetical protein
MPIRCVAGFEKVRLVTSRDSSSPEPCALSRRRGTLYQSQFVKKRFASPFFRPRELEIAMEDALHEINEILERKDINDKHKAHDTRRKRKEILQPLV